MGTRDNRQPASDGLRILARLIAGLHAEAQGAAAMADGTADPNGRKRPARSVPTSSRPRSGERHPFHPVPKQVSRNGPKRKEHDDG